MGIEIRRAGTEDYGRYVKVLVVGEPGAGKTRSASTWPNVLYASAEAGTMSVADRQVPIVDIADSKTLQQLYGILAQAPDVREKLLGVPVDTIVLDTVDEISRILIRERLEREKKETMAIADWGWLGDQLRNIVRGFRNLEMHVVLNVHAKSTEDSETGRIITKAAIQGAMGDEIPGYVDIAVLMTARPMTKVVDGQNMREIVRFWQTYPTPNVPWVKDRSGKLPPEFSITFDDDFKRLEALVYGGAVAEMIIPVAGVVIDVDEPAPKVEAPKKRSTKKEESKPEPEAVVPPTPEPEPVPPEPQPEPEPAPQPEPEPAPEPEPVPVPQVEEPKAEAPPGVDAETGEITKKPEQAGIPKCGECGSAIESRDVADISYIRFRKPLCRKCFVSYKSAAVAS